MAIFIRCTCKSDIRLDAKKCPGCESIIPKERKYRVIVYDNGKRYSKIVPTLAIARDLDAKWKTDILKGEHGIKRKEYPTLRALWGKYLPYIKEHKKSWRTDEYYYMKHLDPAFGDKRLNEISPLDIERLKSCLKNGINKRERPYSEATIKHQLILLSRLFSIAEKWNIFSGPNPCRKVKKPKLNNKVVEFLTDDQTEKLLEVLSWWPDKMSVAIVKFALFTGLRRGELFKLKWADVIQSEKILFVRDPKGGEDRKVNLGENALQVLKEVPREYETPYVFYGRNGNKRTDFKGPWKRIKQAAGLPSSFRFHGLRHNYGTCAIQNHDIYTVMHLMGHKDISTTKKYAHLHNEKLRCAAIDVDSALMPKKTRVIDLQAERYPFMKSKKT